MADSLKKTTGPILLASDLSSRNDRALDRAAAMARHHDVPLIVLHVIEPPLLSHFMPDSWQTLQQKHQASAQDRITQDLDDHELDVRVLVESGSTASVIRSVAKAQGSSLVVTGTARDEALGRVILGSTTERLARESDLPLLIVRRRVPGHYRQVLVGTDFSVDSAQTLRYVLSEVPHDTVTVMHCVQNPTDTEAVRDQLEQFVHDAVRETGYNLPVQSLVALGKPQTRIPDYAEAHRIELVALGTRGASGIVDRGMGSVSEYLMMILPSDVLLLPA